CRWTSSCSAAIGARSRRTSRQPSPSSGPTPASTAGDSRMPPRHPLADTYGQILREQLPNFLRLYLNPYVTQACFCLARYVQTTWGGHGAAGRGYQTFLANGFDEALGGAIKLARYSASVAGRPAAGLVLDPADRLGPYAAASVAGGGRVEFLPGLVV